MTDMAPNRADHLALGPDRPLRFSTAEDVNPPLPGEPGYDEYVRRLSAWKTDTDWRVARLPRVDTVATPYFDGEVGRMVTPEDPAPSQESPTPSSETTEMAAAPSHGRDDGFDPAPGAAADDHEDDQLLRRTDAANGEYFARLHGDRVRFDHRRRRWLIWSGDWWRDDDTDAVRRLAKEAARQRYREALAIEDLKERAQESRFAIGSENRYRLDAMLTQARSEAPIADAGDRWDSDPWLLGVANGVVELRTGHLRPGRPDDLITLHSDVPFDRDALRPRWDRFVDEVFDGDTELVAFVQRAVGYSLTGAVTEQCLFLCHGTGANGKSVFLRTLLALGGGYAANTPFSTFEQHGRASIPNDLAALVAKRIVTASETGEDVRLNEARLKAVTGGDAVTARFLHGEFFTYQPVAKFWLAVNHKPRVTDDSFGFWRRVRLVPFLRRFDKDADPRLLDELLTELPGILAWAIEGVLIWQFVGLAAPAVVRSATESYRVESDPLADFIDACCVERSGLVVRANDAYSAYRAWAGREGLTDREMLSAKAFGTRMTERFEKTRTGAGNVYQGVGLLAERPDEGPNVGSSAGS